MERADEGKVVGTGGFQNDKRARWKCFEDGLVACLGVGEGAGIALEINLQGGFGHIDSDVDRRRGLLDGFHVS